MNDALRSALKKLRLSGLLEGLEVRLQEAAGHGLSHAEFLELILQDELAVRSDRQLQRRVKAALFRELKPLDEFDWSFNPSIKKKQVLDLATCRFVRETRDVLWLGPPGVGKSFLVPGDRLPGDQGGARGAVPVDLRRGPRLPARRGAVGRRTRCCRGTSSPTCLIIDDMGMKQLPKRSGEYLFEIIMRRYETRSTMMTSNRPLEDWGKLLGDVPTATAILDRFLHHAEVVQMNGRSYRLRDPGQGLQEDVGPSKPANAPPGSEAGESGSKPAKAPPGSVKGRASSKPANAPPGSEGPREAEA